MKITDVESIIAIDLTGTLAYDAYASHETPNEARLFLPRRATVSNSGTVSVHGNRVKRNGEPYATDMTIDYRGRGGSLDSQPEFVKRARKLAADYRAEAANAWEVRKAPHDHRARIIREERDALIMAWQNGEIRDLLGAEKFLNRRIEQLGVKTMTGDTTD